jgi:hypothetical protein
LKGLFDASGHGAFSGWQTFKKTFGCPSVAAFTHCFFLLVRRLFGGGHHARSKKRCFFQACQPERRTSVKTERNFLAGKISRP